MKSPEILFRSKNAMLVLKQSIKHLNLVLNASNPDEANVHYTKSRTLVVKAMERLTPSERKENTCESQS